MRPEALARALAEIVSELPSAKVEEAAFAAVDLLMREGRPQDLRIFPRLVRRVLRRLGLKSVEVETPSELSREDHTHLRSALEKALDRAVVIENSAHPSLIGGARIRIGDQRFDGSLRGALDRMPALFSPS